MKRTNYHDVLLPATEVADEARPHRYELGLHHVILGDRTSDQDNGSDRNNIYFTVSRLEVYPVQSAVQ